MELERKPLVFLSPRRSEPVFTLTYSVTADMSEILVKIEQGTLKGTTGEDYHGGKFCKFLGIPYARAPVGDLRFRSPQDPENWTGVRDATKEGPECPAAHMYFGYCVGNEDNCLNLNVYTKEVPKEGSDLMKPVMLWIHGGSFTSGSNKSEMYGPDYLMTQDIVLVIVNYRLGILGFASFKDPALGVPGNAGLKDMRMSLKWVQKNIAQFGGDPGNVTLFGESAGAAAVHCLILSPSTEGLFHKAIIQSGTALNCWSQTKHNSLEIAQCLGYPETDEGEILEKLRREAVKNIIYGQKKFKEEFSAGKMRLLAPVVEPPSPDAILTEDPSAIMRKRGGRVMPLIIGYNSEEGMFFEIVRRTIPETDLPYDLEYEIPFDLGLEIGSEKSRKIAEKLKQAYFGGGQCNEDTIQQVYKLKGDTNFVYPIRRVLKLQAAHSEGPIYAYRMSLLGPLNYFHIFAMVKYFKTTLLCILLGKLSSNYVPLARNVLLNLIRKFPRKNVEGVVHADDLLYLFPTFYTPEIKKGTVEDLHVQRFVRLWTNFARFGNPTPAVEQDLNGVEWRPVGSCPDKLRLLDIGQELRMIDDVDGERLQIWDEIYEEVQGSLIDN